MLAMHSRYQPSTVTLAALAGQAAVTVLSRIWLVVRPGTSRITPSLYWEAGIADPPQCVGQDALGIALARVPLQRVLPQRLPAYHSSSSIFVLMVGMASCQSENSPLCIWLGSSRR